MLCIYLRCLYLDRIDRLKAARTEAAKEIEALKAQKNEEFHQFETEVPIIIYKLIAVTMYSLLFYNAK